MSRLRVGVIGLGVGAQHVEGYERHSDCEIAALCDIDADRLQQVGANWPTARRTTDAETVLDDPTIDVVSIASWEDAHHPQVTQALRADKHVFVEKPLCQTEDQAHEIATLLRERPHLRLSSNLPLRRSPRFELVRRWLTEGEFGRVYYLEADYDYGRLHKLTGGWRGDLPYYSVVQGGGVHVIDLLLWLTGDRAVEVQAMGNGIATEGTKFRFDDLVVATVRMASGVVAKVGCNFACVHPHFHGLRVYGTDATFVNAPGDATLWRRSTAGAASEAVTAPYPGVHKAVLIDSFVQAVLGRGEAAVTEQEVLGSMAVCLAIDRAAAEGITVPVPHL